MGNGFLFQSPLLVNIFVISFMIILTVMPYPIALKRHSIPNIEMDCNRGSFGKN